MLTSDVGQNRVPLTVDAVVVGPAGGIVQEIMGLDVKFRKGTRYALDLTLEELRENGQLVDLGSQTVLLANTTFFGLIGLKALVEVAWPETAAIANGSLIQGCAQIIDFGEADEDDDSGDDGEDEDDEDEDDEDEDVKPQMK